MLLYPVTIPLANPIRFINIIVFNPKMLIDIHSHLDHAYFKDDLDEVIDNARKANVKIILTAGLNPETNRKTLELAQRYDIVKPCLGIYPIQTLQKDIESGNLPLKKNQFDLDEELGFIKKNKDKITAIGEIGLDYSAGEEPKGQKEVFEKLISLAEKINKPIIVHSRKAESDCVEMLQSSKLKNIVMHCFCGRKSLVKRIVDNGWFLTIPTSVARSFQFQENAKNIPITQLFCETDAPFLSPFTGKRNEPAFVAEAYKKIAEIKGMELIEVVNNIWMNWQKIL
jgi:TatD DNase family protein